MGPRSSLEEFPLEVFVLVVIAALVVAVGVAVMRRGESSSGRSSSTSSRPAPPPPPSSSCPICHQTIYGDGSYHWQEHVVPDGTGGYTWSCSCGPAPQEWINSAAAGFGLVNHMRQRHGIGRI